MQKKTRKGITWDGTDQLDFLLDKLEVLIKRDFPEGVETNTAPKQPATAGGGNDDGDDLPF